MVTLLLNTVLTVLKFVVFAFTGSLAILAEAWHSFGDIATSATALLSVRQQARRVSRDGDEPPEYPPNEEDPSDGGAGADDSGASEGDESEGSGRPSAWQRAPLRQVRAAALPVGRLFRRIWALQPEQEAALLIGLFLAGIGIALLRKVVTSEATEVARPMVAGVVFLLFSVASYAVSRFELGVGKAEGSPALVADGMHARADAVATLLTGGSLILYYFGVNIDRLMAGILGLVILSFAAETLVNLLVGALRGEERYVLRHRSTDVIGALLDPRLLGRAWGRIGGRLASGGPFARAMGRAIRATPWLAGLVALLWYGSTCLYTVAPQEQAVVERLGRVASPDSPVGPGLHLKAPWPVDQVFRVESRRIRTLSAGNETRDATVPMIWTRQHGTDEVFVSGDNNFFYPYIAVHYLVSDVYAYRYSVAEPDRVLEDIALRVMTSLFAQHSFYAAALEERARLADEVRESVQREADESSLGIEIVHVVVKDIHPPRDAARSFEGVVAAMQDHQTLVNQAQGYRTEKIPEARSTAVRRVAEAHAYVADNKIRSEGDATRFKLRRSAYAQGRAVTRQRLYLDAMVSALKGRRKVLISPDAGQPDLWLDDTVAPPPREQRKRGVEGESSTSRKR